MATLTLELWTENGDFHLSAESDSFEKELRLAGRAAGIVDALHAVYDAIEELETDRAAKVEKTLRELGAEILAPISAAIDAAELVRFVIDDELVRCPFDLLHHAGRPLYLSKRICFQMEEGDGDDDAKVPLGSALLIADLSADPEEAVKAVAKLMDEPEYLDVENASLAKIRKVASEIDVLVISGHGDLEDDGSGSVEIGDEELEDDVIEELEAWLVYFDSCQMGSNTDFLTAFQEESDVQFYLAPITSNDAGDSSTKTMTWFFEGVKAHGNPIRALADTRQRLFEHYSGKKKLDLVTVLNKSASFRIYEFVGEE